MNSNSPNVTITPLRLGDRRRASALYTRAQRASVAGDYDTAILCYTEMIELDMHSQIATLNRANMRAIKGDFEGAIEDCNALLAMEETRPASRCIAYTTRGHAERELGQFQAAVASLDEASLLADKSQSGINQLASYMFFNRALAHSALGDHDKARSDADNAVKFAQSGSSTVISFAYAGRGAVLSAVGEHDAAQADFENAIHTARGLMYPLAWAYYQRGVAQLARGLIDLALSDFNEGISANPQLSVNYQGRAKVYDTQGHADLAQADREKLEALREPPEPRPDLIKDVNANYNAARIRFVLIYAVAVFGLVVILQLLGSCSPR